MSSHIAFLRAINVAGHSSVRMVDLRGVFADAGCRDVRSYIQSGNVIFNCRPRDAAGILRKVRAAFRAVSKSEPEIVLRTAGELQDLVRHAPFKDLENEKGIKLYVAFLFRKPRSRPALPVVSIRDALQAVAMTDREVFVVSRRKTNGFFGFPNNFVEESLGVTATTRNWSTLTRILRFVREDAACD